MQTVTCVTLTSNTFPCDLKKNLKIILRELKYSELQIKVYIYHHNENIE